jgi:hypothetical protein
MKKFTLVCCLALSISDTLYPVKLNNQLLKAADDAGFFNRGIIDILKVRQRIKDFLFGKLIWSGAELSLNVVDGNQSSLNKTFNIIIKRPETLFGASFVVIASNHPLAQSLCTEATKTSVEIFLNQAKQLKLVQRYQQATLNGINTGLFVKNPMNDELMPIFIADYILEDFDSRITHAHIAVPAHNQKDFEFAKSYKLPIKLVIDSVEQGKTSSPQYDKNSKQLTLAYQGEYDDCIIVNSEFLNGTINNAHEKAMKHLTTQAGATEYQKPYLYQLGQKQYSLKELQIIEGTILKDNKTLSEGQKEQFDIVLVQARADFITIVEQFLINAKSAKDLMGEIVNESCKLRQNTNAYILKWAHINTTESEKVIFKRDISTLTSLSVFCNELIDFLEDFASSCPNALENLKKLKHT